QPVNRAQPAGTAQPAWTAQPGASARPAGNGAGPVTGQPVTGGPAGGPPGTVPRRVLPHRTRQASLSPHLRDNLAADRPAASPAAPPDGRTPEQARDLAASLQTGWRRGRQDDDVAEPPDTAAPPLPRRTGSPAPDGEEA
ncbi:MAG: hypothetical protein ACRDND_25870, partial [Streptosporangiaceae bacterium]